jgi:hypothetical protein
MINMNENMVNVGQNVNFNISKNVSLLGFTNWTFPYPPSSGWLANALLAY